MEVLVKVGKKTSELRFSNSIAHRAVTTYELKRNVEAYPKCTVLIVEGVYEEEERELREFLDVWHRDKEHKTLFMCGADSFEGKFARDNSYTSVVDLKSLYSKLREYGYEVSTLVDDIKNINIEKEQVSKDTDNIKVASSELSGAIEQLEQADIESSEQREEEFKSIDAEMAKCEAEVHADNQKEFVSAELSEQKIKYIKLEGKYKKVELDLESANKKIEKLRELLDTAREENTKLGLKVEKLSLDTELAEDTVAKSEYDSLKDTLEESNRKSTVLRNQIDAIKEFNDNLKESLKTKEAELAEALKTADKYRKQLAEVNSSANITDDEEITELKGQVRSQERTIAAKIEEAARLGDKVASLESTIEDLYDRITAESDISSKKNDVVMAVLEKMNTLIAESSESKIKIDNLTSEVEDCKNQLAEKSSLLDKNSAEYAKAKASADSVETKIKVAVADKEREVEQLKAKVGSLEAQLNSIKKVDSDNITSLRKQLEESKQQLNEQAKQMTESSISYAKMKEQVDAVETRIQIAIADEKREKEAVERKLQQCETKLETTESQLETKTMQYDNLIGNIGMDVDGVQTIIAENKALQSTNATLSAKLSAKVKDGESLERTINGLKNKLKEAEESNKQMQSSLRNLSGLGGGDSKSASALVNAIKYREPSQIIPVIGCGSYGVTSVAYSLAYKLGNSENTLIADFDLFTPSLDAWFNKNPIYNDIVRFVGDSKKATSLGLFFEKGSEAFEKLSERMIIPIERVKGGSINYLSGVYYKPDPIKVGTADYEGFFRTLGKRYSNIVIDFGKLGVSELHDQLIKAVSEISMKVIVVTPNDRFKVREMRMKLDGLGISTANVSWLLNMSKTTSVEDNVRKYIGKAKISIMPFEADFYGSKDKFSRNKLTRDKFELFVSQNLLGK